MREALSAIARQILSTVAKNVHSTEHFVNLRLITYMKKTLCKLNKDAFLKYVDLSSITVKNLIFVAGAI